MVAAAMTALIPGAGPPPTRIASVFFIMTPILPNLDSGSENREGDRGSPRAGQGRSEVGEQSAAGDDSDPERERQGPGQLCRPRRGKLGLPVADGPEGQ